MKFKKIDEVNEFKGILNNAKGKVWAEDAKGDSFDLKDERNQYVVIGDMIEHEDNSDMQIFTNNSDDDAALEKFFIQKEAEEEQEEKKEAAAKKA